MDHSTFLRPIGGLNILTDDAFVLFALGETRVLKKAY
jgi:hypothetical protein